MSLMRSLTKVAAGVMLAKGIGAAMNKGQHGSTTGASRSSKGGLLDSLLGNNTGGSGGSLSDTLSRALGGRTGQGTTGHSAGGLGGLLDSLSGKSGSGSGGGLGGMLGGLLGGAAAGGAAGSLAQKGAQPSNNATFGELFNDSIANGGEPTTAPTAEQNALAGLMLRAMIQAAKSDGTIDDAEKQRLLGHVGDDLDDDERAFIREQMTAPVDAKALAAEVPDGMQSQVYLMSLLAIDFDSEAEARYLNDLAVAMDLDRAEVNRIHDEAGVMPLYNRS
ncbi:tellurite resistance TerB family protein [Paracoccus sediminilitoris]|uniref:tellurite resistance TerB family protein n=1 Tax=Paracoccus sediminilitoris TaxID=2202419 RepID=UPI00272B4B45|nr:tellurite resistance TerB family protein [Paracoccus sediminilitoris]